MAKKTTVKPTALAYRAIGTMDEYIPLMGVLKGLSISQDEPDSTEIEAEFYDSPFDIFYDGNPVTMTFELANYDLEELPDLFGGQVIESGGDAGDYDGETNAYTSEWEWKLNFGRGYACITIPRGLTIGTIKKDADGALNYSVTITALTYVDRSVDPAKEVMYRIFNTDTAIEFYNRIKIDDTEYTIPDSGTLTISISGGDPQTLTVYGKNFDKLPDYDVGLKVPHAVFNDDDDPNDWKFGVVGEDGASITIDIERQYEDYDVINVYKTLTGSRWFRINTTP